MDNLTDKQYLGDGVYCGHDGYQIWLWLDNGAGSHSHIAIDPVVFSALQRYAAKNKAVGR